MVEMSKDKIGVYEFIASDSMKNYQDFSLVDMVEILTNALTTVPDIYKSNATIDFTCYDEYMEYDVYYKREETGSEYHSRMDEILIIENDSKKEQREEYERLHEIYGGEANLL